MLRLLVLQALGRPRRWHAWQPYGHAWLGSCSITLWAKVKALLARHPTSARLPPCLRLQGITGSFSGVDASGRFKQATLQLGGGGSGSSKPSGGAAGSGPASGAGAGRASGGSGIGSALGFGFGVQQQQPGKAKKKIYDADGAWNGCCFCGVRAKVGRGGQGPSMGLHSGSCICQFACVCWREAAASEVHGCTESLDSGRAASV